MKIAVMGYSGSGKSTFAGFLGKSLDLPVLHLDTVQFTAGWNERDRAEALAVVSEFMKKDGWVIDGNYTSFFQNERLEQADYIFYLDFSRISCLYRAYSRYLKNRGKTRVSMAEGCEEKFDLEFLWWILHNGRTAAVRKHYRDVLGKYKEKAHIIKNQKQLSRAMFNLQDYIK